jgi:hypothetical protein
MLILLLLTGGWVSGEGFVFPIVAATPIAHIAEDGNIPLCFEVLFRPQVSLSAYLSFGRESSPLLQGCDTYTLRCRRNTKRSISWLVANDQFEVNETFAQYEISKHGVPDESRQWTAFGMAEFGYSSRYRRDLLARSGNGNEQKLKEE